MEAGITGYEYILLGLLLFSVGIVGIAIRRNVIFVLISIEVAINGVFLILFGGSLKVGPAAQALILVIMAVAAAEAAIGLALAVSIFRTARTVNIDELSDLKR